MKNFMSAVLFSVTFAGCATASAANPITSVSITLPDTHKWSQITDKSEGGQYIREWVPEGSTGETAKWLIVEQKFVLRSGISAEKFIKTMFAMARKACSDILYNGPEKLDAGGHETYVGRFMCAQQQGKDYGTFTDQRVAAQGNEMYVITSELRVPGSPKAGVLSFKLDQPNGMEDFIKLQELSGRWVRDAVKICTAGTDCK